MGGSVWGESVDAGNEDGGKSRRGTEREEEEHEGRRSQLSSLHGHRLWAFFTAGGQMK